jgi:hypothetical protein
MTRLGRLARKSDGRVVLEAGCEGRSSEAAGGEVIVLCSAGAAVDAVPVAWGAVVGSSPVFVISSSEDSSRKGPRNMLRA